MHNSVWKLTSLATVAGAALLFIVQAQKHMKPQADQTQTGGTEEFAEESSDSFEDDADFSAEMRNAGTNGQRSENSSIEPDPFADENRGGIGQASATYENSFDHDNSDSDYHSARNSARSVSGRRALTRNSPTPKLPPENSETNPFEDEQNATSEESGDFGPRLSLPKKHRGNRPVDDLSTEKKPDAESHSRTIRTISAEDDKQIPTLGLSTNSDDGEIADDADFRTGDVSSHRLKTDSEAEHGPSLIQNPAISKLQSDTEPMEFPEEPKDSIKSVPSLNEKSLGSLDDEGSDLLHRSPEREDPADFENEPRFGEMRKIDGQERLNSYAPTHPEPENPMPKAVSLDDNSGLFQDHKKGLESPTLDDDHDESFSTELRKMNPRLKGGRNPEELNTPTQIPIHPSEEGMANLEGKPHLGIEKKSPPSATLGQKMVYEIRVFNPGSVSAEQVVLNDDVPEGVTLDGTVPRAELSGRKLIWRLGTLRPGEEKLVKVRVIPVRVGEVGSVATVNYLSENETSENVPARHLLEGNRSLPQVPRLLIESSSIPETLGTNQRFRVVLTVKNIDERPLKNIVLSADLDPKVRHQEVEEQRIEARVLELLPGQEEKIDLDLVGVQPGMAINRLTLWIDDQPVRESEMNFRILPR